MTEGRMEREAARAAPRIPISSSLMISDWDLGEDDIVWPPLLALVASTAPESLRFDLLSSFLLLLDTVMLLRLDWGVRRFLAWMSLEACGGQDL
ncbi:hypothetical protein AXX17_AT4G02010 [Arabidopsis thaliana]|uniref:Uncharacterized protein n=1 Tax=Arabidopsis thaliana TaxID=3702 RepID=A0A178V562_ARATH|nr:hypothetical protein AXX17_AT4G02010 [Arabidopsis thaliana]